MNSKHLKKFKGKKVHVDYITKDSKEGEEEGNLVEIDATNNTIVIASDNAVRHIDGDLILGVYIKKGQKKKKDK